MTTMSAIPRAEGRAQGAPPALPRQRDVLRAQLRATGFVLRIPFAIAALLGVVATIVTAVEAVREGVALQLHAQPVEIPAIIGALLPLVLWAWEDRYGPGFFWTLPVDRSRHALIKVLAGWIWLMGGVALLSLGLLVLALVTGGRVLPVETLHVLTAAVPRGTPIDPAALRLVQWAPGPLIWIVPFTAATAGYLFASAFMLGLRHPLRWVIGLVLAFAVLSILSEADGALRGAAWVTNAPERVLSWFCAGRYGLDALLTARTALLDDVMTLKSGELVNVWYAVPSLADWGIATLLWTGAGLLALLAAASRHRERRRP